MLKYFSEDELRKAIANLDVDEYDRWGIRVCGKKYEIGETCDNSHQLYEDPQFADDEMTELLYPYIEEGIYAGYYDGGELDGVCTVGFDPENEDDIDKAIKEVSGYESLGEYLYIVAGDGAMSGNDYKEIIIEDAKVVWRGERIGK